MTDTQTSYREGLRDALHQLRNDAVAARNIFRNVDARSKARELGANEYFKIADAAGNSEKLLASALEKIPDESFALEAKTHDGRLMLLNASAQKPGHWQITRFDANGDPWGDTQYSTKLQAIREFLADTDIATVNDFDQNLTKAA